LFRLDATSGSAAQTVGYSKWFCCSAILAAAPGSAPTNCYKRVSLQATGAAVGAAGGAGGAAGAAASSSKLRSASTVMLCTCITHQVAPQVKVNK